ncbi:MAG: hypothetical protein L0H53_12565 [Candidatus Nitrosocosmicus sp.]|nr:hypothetical protein [Candidatus Nitrosocosmicus sp.]MDN5867941.1 hypothetical protein [Candidatus Nitrosocosmicus sp.]
MNASKILIIGVRPNPEDKHVWNFLATTDAEIGYIGDEEFLNWKSKYGKNKNKKFLGKYWNDSFNKSVSFLK